MKLHHIAIATRNPQKYIDMFYRMEGTIKYTEGIAKDYETKCIFIKGENFEIELITPTVKGNHIDCFIDKRGDALHHFAIMGKGKKKGALKDMFVDFNKIDKDNKILIEQVEFR